MMAMGAAYALKQFVYEPYVAPQLERWAQAFVESRRRYKEEQRERRMHAPMMAMRESGSPGSGSGGHGYGYVPLEGEENEHRRTLSGKPRARSEWDDAHSPMSASFISQQPVPAELEKLVERERLAWAERELPPNMPLPASALSCAPGLRKRGAGSRQGSRPQSFVEITEGPGIPASAYIPLTPQTTHTGSPRASESRLQRPLSPAHGQGLTTHQPLLSPPMSATSPLAPSARALSPRSDLSAPQAALFSPQPLLGAVEDLRSPPAGERSVHLILRSPTYPTASSGQAPEHSALAVGSPYPSRPASALSSVLSPPHSPFSIARTPSWTALSRASSAMGMGAGSDMDVLSQSSMEGFGTDEEDEGVGSEWDNVSRRSGVSGEYVRM